jgi:undecaprenyl-diphosphatase
MSFFTFVGSPLVVIPAAIFVFGFAMRRRDYRACLVLVIEAAISETLLVLLKDTFERARPTLFGHLVLPSYSFPSGHALAAVAVYGSLGIVLTRLIPARRRIFEIGCPILISMIGLSRVYLGVHWPTDVLAGFAAGGFLVLAGAITLDGLPTVRVTAR